MEKNLPSSGLLWLDMEMTGLDPEVCVPLQVALVVTDDHLQEHEAIEITIWQPDQVLATMTPVVRKMHTDNGLLDQVRRSETDIRQATAAMFDLVARSFGFQKAVLAGNSVHVDRQFLVKYFPTVEGYLHYRMVDVSTFKELVRRWYGEQALYGKDDSKHTALADIRESIAELRHFRSTVMR